MEWEPIEIDSVNNSDEEQEFDQEINEYIQWEDEYNLYISSLAEQQHLSYLNALVENYTGNYTMQLWIKWSEVPVSLHLEIYKLLMYQIEQKKFNSISLKELNNDNAYYNYLLFLANVLYKV